MQAGVCQGHQRQGELQWAVLEGEQNLPAQRLSALAWPPPPGGRDLGLRLLHYLLEFQFRRTKLVLEKFERAGSGSRQGLAARKEQAVFYQGHTHARRCRPVMGSERQCSSKLSKSLYQRSKPGVIAGGRPQVPHHRASQRGWLLLVRSWPRGDSFETVGPMSPVLSRTETQTLNCPGLRPHFLDESPPGRRL